MVGVSDASAEKAVRAKGLNPALLVWGAALAITVGLVACGETGTTPAASGEATPAAGTPLPGARVEFKHPLSTQLDDMMRADKDVIAIGDADFIGRMRAQEAALGGSVHYLELPQMDLYAAVALYPAILASKAKMFVMESIPSYWTGEVYMAVQPPASAVKAAIDQVPETEPTVVAAPPAPGREYIKPVTKPFKFEEPMKLVFDNYYGFWREIDDCTLWVTNDELLAAAPADFQAAYKAKFADPATMHVNVGHVGGLDYAPTLLSGCKAAKAAAPPG
jgi:hypothetical protein